MQSGQLITRLVEICRDEREINEVAPVVHLWQGAFRVYKGEIQSAQHQPKPHCTDSIKSQNSCVSLRTMFTMMMAQVAGDDNNCPTPAVTVGWEGLAVDGDGTHTYQLCSYICVHLLVLVAFEE